MIDPAGSTTLVYEDFPPKDRGELVFRPPAPPAPQADAMPSTLRYRLLVLGVLLATSRLASAAEPLAVWVVDPHTKVFRDTPAAAEGRSLQLRAARNEYEPGQIALRSSEPLAGVRLETSALKHTEGTATLAAECLTWNFLGFIPIERNTGAVDKRRICTAPCDVPDPLLEERTLDLKANTTQPVWLTVRVPADATAGVYRGQVTVVAGTTRIPVPLELSIDPFTLPNDRHLLVTNWFATESIAQGHHVELWSEACWELLRRYAENMAAHRQNVVITPWSLVDVTREEDGRLSLDFARFDRFVEIFEKTGVADRIELGHVGNFGPQGWVGDTVLLTQLTVLDRKSDRRITLDAQEGILPFLTQLEKHLDQRGWLSKSLLHVADEPSIHTLESWRKISAQVHQAAPRLRRIDAIETVGFDDALEVWVPKLSHFERWREAYEARRPGNEFWYYLCCHPVGDTYPNRFLDYPLSDVRLFHWINWSENLAGYLHWGGTYWNATPFGAPSKELPPGDTHVLYPGSQGPLNSIRWEMERESLEDFEYLHLLAAKTAQLKEQFGPAARLIDPRRRATELSRVVVPSITNVTRDAGLIQAVRRQIAEEIVALDQSPRMLLQTEPAEGTPVYVGPIPIDLYGVADPETQVTVNGQPVRQRPDGSFGTCVFVEAKTNTITIELQRKGQKKTLTRTFPVKG